jgi:hypothetical protein
MRTSSRSGARYCVSGYVGTSVENGRPSCSHFERPPSRIRSRSSGKPNSRKTQNAYVAHQLFLSPYSTTVVDSSMPSRRSSAWKASRPT